MVQNRASPDQVRGRLCRGLHANGRGQAAPRLPLLALARPRVGTSLCRCHWTAL